MMIQQMLLETFGMTTIHTTIEMQTILKKCTEWHTNII